MEDAIEELVRLARPMAHRIRDELSVTQNAVELLMKDQSISSEVREKIGSIKGQVHQAAASAAQFLRITKTEHAHQEVVNVREVLSTSSPLLQCLLGDNVHLHMELDQDLWRIKINLEQFEQIFCILAVNATDAMPAGGTFQIRAINIIDGIGKNNFGVGAAAGCVRITISDTGVGIPKGMVGRLFDPFFTTKGAGHGFGLAKVYGVVNKFGGRITVDSEPGQGTVFRVFLPRCCQSKVAHGKPCPA
jgi:two-component system, cell cycle sensor histidine kinase and response regulator CckA